MRAPDEERAKTAVSGEFASAKKAEPWILAATILGSSMAFIDGTVVNVAIPALQSAFGAGIVDVQWVIEGYALFLSALILAGGALGDRYGRRLLFLLGVGIFAAASAACGFSGTIRQLIIARCIQGIGAALLVPGSLAIISASFGEESRGKAIGTWSGFTAITTALGPVLGGWLIQNASWRWVFFLNLPLAIAVVLISMRHIPESRSSEAKSVDWLGAGFIIAGLAGVVNGLVESVNLGWSNPMVVASLIGGVASLVGFVVVERRVEEPMVPPGLFKSRSFSGANLLTLLLYAGLSIFFFLYPMNLIQVQGYSTTETALAALPAILLLFTLSRWSGGLIHRYGARRPLLLGPVITATAFVFFAFAPIGASYWKTFFPGFVILGLGMAVTIAPLTTVVMGSVSQDHAGTASGINNAVSRVAGVLAIAVFGVVMVSCFSSRLNESLAELHISADALHEIQANETKLGALAPPSGLPANTATEVRAAIASAFAHGFRLIMLICAGLAIASGAAAWGLIPAQAEPQL
jgi:EmrB/QacA subfamily drug resistance transporter